MFTEIMCLECVCVFFGGVSGKDTLKIKLYSGQTENFSSVCSHLFAKVHSYGMGKKRMKTIFFFTPPQSNV